MIGELAFKNLCRYAVGGLPVRALFITPGAAEREEQKLGMLNEAMAQGLNTEYYHNLRTMNVGPCVVYQRIAHAYLDRELKGLEWHFIDGLEYLEKFEDGEAIQANLIYMERS